MQNQDQIAAPWWSAFRLANASNRSEFEALLRRSSMPVIDPAPEPERKRGADVRAHALDADSPSIDEIHAPPPFAAGARRASGARSRRYDRSLLGADLAAGATVALVAIPQSLAYAQLAGVPAYFGLYAALLPTIVGAVFGSSRQLSTGPSAVSALLTAASIAHLAPTGSATYIAYVVLLGLLAGGIQLALGLLRAGVLLNFLSHPVLMGFVNAAALIIGLSQLPTLLGIVIQPSEHFLIDVWHLAESVDTLHVASLAFGLGAFAMLLALKRWAPRLPGVLIVVALLTWLSYAIDYAGMGGAIVGSVPSGLPQLGFELPRWSSVVTLAPAAFVLAMLSFMEAVSSAKIIAIKTRQPWNENRELVGQGLAKIASAACQTMPVSGSFSRSALNLASGARTPLASIVAALCVLVTLLFFTGLLHHLPKPVLAAVIVMAVVGLVDVNAIVQAWHANRDDGAAAIATFVATLAFAPHIEYGIVTGIVLSLALLLYRLMRPRVTLLDVRSDGFLAETRRPSGVDPRIGAIRFDGDLRFVNVSWFEDALLKLEQSNPALECILVKANGINHVDASGVEAIANLVRRLGVNGVTLAFSGINASVREVMDRTGLTDVVGRSRLFATDREALDAFRQGAVAAGPHAPEPSGGVV